MAKITDLSSPLKIFSMDALEVKIRHIDHAEARRMKAAAAGIRLEEVTFAGADDLVFSRTHAGTHVDAPWHFGPTVEGKLPRKIDEVPLEWCYGNGVLLDFSRTKKPGEAISMDDLKRELRRINYTLRPRDIVVLRTGAEDHAEDPKFEQMASGLHRDSLWWLLDQGIRMIGTDSYTLDTPIPRMVEKLRGGNKADFFPVHYGGREREYVHTEKLYNLKGLSRPWGFKIAIFPIKLEAASGSWTRAVAIEGEDLLRGEARLLDLSLPLMAHGFDRTDTQIEYFTHREGSRRLAKRFGIPLNLLPNPYLWATEDVTCSSQAGTHVNAPFYFGPGTPEAPARTIDQVPLEMLYGEAVLLDFSRMDPSSLIQVADLKKELQRIGAVLKPGYIVLLRTGAEDHILEDPHFSAKATRLSAEGFLWLAENGIRTIGSDALLCGEMGAQTDSGNGARLHKTWEESGNCVAEKLFNLKNIPRPSGFKAALFPVKLDRCCAAWTRAVAIF